jgi:hypothetical protein
MNSARTASLTTTMTLLAVERRVPAKQQPRDEHHDRERRHINKDGDAEQPRVRCRSALIAGSLLAAPSDAVVMHAGRSTQPASNDLK